MYYLGVDPGSDKVGVIVVDDDLYIEYQAIIKAKDFVLRFKSLIEQYQIKKVIIGDGTASEELIKIAKEIFHEVVKIDERNSTLDAKQEYFSDNPPSGLKRLLPLSLQIPSRAIDDYAALVIVKRYLKDKN